MSIVKNYITKNKNLINDLNVSNEEISCPNLVDENKDNYSIAINDLTRLIFKRELLNKSLFICSN